ncbi:Rrf2 family transcriptional regulator [Desulfosporosinus metallidurans]|uniref:Rrf2 family transcriptional regulator, group III n=1 Tax=Desulfosporosinus metallidurans TaxID=1888891 RepID=A0A1Q8QZ64_9FIRM|nr:Rrf2 family transcriptional regulator [Desulfosporosinus metallidurans]OLN32591.1 Rrf2 family transcriptional regulator, group III [Desulfosporosinus metallidurans]
MKKLSSRFSIAVHILTLTAITEKNCTSEYIASSVNTNPVLIRRIIGFLKKAGLINVHGTGGTYIQKDISKITLLDVYNAVEVTEDHELFNFHKGNCKCKVGANIESIVGATLNKAQIAMENELRQVTIQNIVKELNKIN